MQFLQMQTTTAGIAQAERKHCMPADLPIHVGDIVDAYSLFQNTSAESEKNLGLRKRRKDEEAVKVEVTPRIEVFVRLSR